MPRRVYYPRCRVALSVILEGEDERPHRYEVVPVSAEVVRNDHRTADTFVVELDYRDLPLDPRVLRQVLVGVYMDDQREPGRPLRLENRRDLQFIGYVDEPRMTLDGDTETVRLEGRDYTGILLDFPWPGDEPIDITRPLHQVIGGILARVPGAQGIPVEFVRGVSNIVLADRLGRTKWTPKGREDDAWTVLVDLCQTIGLIAVFELDTLFIRDPGEAKQNTAVMVYGENVSRLEMRRNLSDVVTKQVRLVCWDEQAGESREGVYPAEPIVVKKKVSPNGKVSEDTAPIMTFTVTGQFSADQLRERAERVFRDMAHEFEGQLTTRDMQSFGYDDKLVRLANADHVKITIGRGAQARVAGLSDAEARRVLTSGPRGLDPRLVEVLLASRRRAEELGVDFYVKTASHRWSRQDGYELTIQFQSLLGV